MVTALGLAVLVGGCAPRPHPRRPTESWARGAAMRPQTGPASRPSSRPAVRVSPMQVQTLASQTFFYVRARATYPDLEDAAAEALTALERAAADGRVTFAAPR